MSRIDTVELHTQAATTARTRGHARCTAIVVGQSVRPEPVATTLLDLVFALESVQPLSEDAVVEIALELVKSRRVKLTGIYRDKAPETLAPPSKPHRLN